MEEIDDTEYEVSLGILNEELKSLNMRSNDLVAQKKKIENTLVKLNKFTGNSLLY